MRTVVLLALSSCARFTAGGQPVPERVLRAAPGDFEGGDGVVLHYYGAGGWGVLWRGSYVLTAPYFSNHALVKLRAFDLEPDLEAVRAGLAGTPVAQARALLIGHGHIDHAGDVEGLLAAGLPAERVALVADRSTVNLLAPFRSRFGCVDEVRYGDDASSALACAVPGVRVTPIHSEHAPHLELAGVEVRAFNGVQERPRAEPPRTGDDFKLGYVWAYLIDLLDDDGAIAFRIHYMDAAAAPPHGLASSAAVAERPVDVHIACVPGFDFVDGYPAAVLMHHRARYVMAGHWEDFFRPRRWDLELVPVILDQDRIDRFIGEVGAALGPERIEPLNPRCDGCGPRGSGWAWPVPGETYRFAVTPGVPKS